ncbi:unnamed protein product [Ixodes persulcatus]
MSDKKSLNLRNPTGVGFSPKSFPKYSTKASSITSLSLLIFPLYSISLISRFRAYFFSSASARLVGCSPNRNFSERARTTAPLYFSLYILSNSILMSRMSSPQVPGRSHSTRHNALKSSFNCLSRARAWKVMLLALSTAASLTSSLNPSQASLMQVSFSATPRNSSVTVVAKSLSFKSDRFNFQSCQLKREAVLSFLPIFTLTRQWSVKKWAGHGSRAQCAVRQL